MHRIHLVRHGLSESNLSTEVNKRKPDHAIELAPEGHEQAKQAGRFLGEHIQEGVPGFHRRRVLMLVSPYLRTRQTADGVEDGIRRQGLEYVRREALSLRGHGRQVEGRVLRAHADGRIAGARVRPSPDELRNYPPRHG